MTYTDAVFSFHETVVQRLKFLVM